MRCPFPISDGGKMNLDMPIPYSTNRKLLIMFRVFASTAIAVSLASGIVAYFQSSQTLGVIALCTFLMVITRSTGHLEVRKGNRIPTWKNLAQNSAASAFSVILVSSVMLLAGTPFSYTIMFAFAFFLGFVMADIVAYNHYWPASARR